jgi:hypothetical protein
MEDELFEPVGVGVEEELQREEGGEADADDVEGVLVGGPALGLGDDGDEVLAPREGGSEVPRGGWVGMGGVAVRRIYYRDYDQRRHRLEDVGVQAVSDALLAQRDARHTDGSCALDERFQGPDSLPDALPRIALQIVCSA